MPDKFSKQVRSKIMSSIKSKNTKPEITVRKLLWAKGRRYRIHDKSIFGTPDISSKKNRVAIFIDGCFWHGCKICYRKPKTNTKFWSNKIRSNRKRRNMVLTKLQNDGWRVLEIWEHEIELKPQNTAVRISKMLRYA